LDAHRDRLATFEPQLVAKYQRRLPGFDDHVISMYARGMSVREIQGHLLELYGRTVSPDLISTITNEVPAEVDQWRQRPLEAMYPITYFDALRLEIRDEGGCYTQEDAMNMALLSSLYCACKRGREHKASITAVATVQNRLLRRAVPSSTRATSRGRTRYRKCRTEE
jgi:hypothetical protein